MTRSKRRWTAWLVISIAMAVVFYYGFRTPPVEVDLIAATYGPLTVTVDEDGKTRVRERYLVSAPLAGRLLRVELHGGDSLVANETVLATIEASDPSLLDERARADAEARVNAATAERDRAMTRIEVANDSLGVARNELDRAEQLFGKSILPEEAYEATQLKYRLAVHEKQSAEFGLKIAEFELDQARSALLRYGPRSEEHAELFRYVIRTPITGRVFRVFQESSTDVAPGTRLLEVGNPDELEVEIDVLSEDAVRIRPGTTVWLNHWGGSQSLEARVRLVEPSAFTKLSALGIEEQRVWVIADLVTPASERSALGDGFRVEASIVVAENPRALKIPAGCLFRTGDEWSVFLVRKGRAERRLVRVGLTNGIETEVTDGLALGDQLILHPSDRVSHGTKVISR